MSFTKGHTGYRTTESYELASVKITASPNSARTRFKPGSSGFTGTHSEETREKIREARARQGSNVWNKGTCESGMKGKHHSLESRRKSSESQSGDKNHNWLGGLTAINHALRRTLEAKLWRGAVFKRDNYTCVICSSYGCELNADHIKKWADYPELRFDLSNGRTLCVPCHRLTPNYGNKR